MNKKNKPFFGTNISEEDMKDSGLFISENTEPIGYLDAWDADWKTWKADWKKEKRKRKKIQREWKIKHEKSVKRFSVVSVFVGILGWVFNYLTAVTAFSAMDSSYSNNANFFIGVSGVGFAFFAGYMAYTVITSTFNWFEARRNLIELGG